MSEAVLPSYTYSLSHQLFEKITNMVNAETGIQFLPEKHSLVQARISKRIRKLGLDSFEAYFAYLNGRTGEDERKTLVSVLTTNVTRFFRENHHFEHMKQDVLPRLIARAKQGGRVRIWSAGCSSGEEPYSIALSVLSLERDIAKYDFKILASDLDPVVVKKAERGSYRNTLLASLPKDLRSTYFRPDDSDTGLSSSATKSLRELIAFRELNLMHAWPFRGLFDIVFCRNVVIYFDATTSDEVWSKFANQLAGGGMLYVGHSERVGNADHIGLVSVGGTAYKKLSL